MQCIYNYLHETKHISRLYNVPAILQLQFLLQCNDISQAECFVLLHHYFPKYMCSAQYGCFCSFIQFPGMLLRFLIAWYHFMFHVSQALSFYCEISIFQHFFGLLSLSHFYIQKLQYLLTDMFLVYSHGLLYQDYYYYLVMYFKFILASCWVAILW